MKVKCPHCGFVQDKHKKLEKADIMKKFFNFTWKSSVPCEKCKKYFVEEENEV